MSFWRTIFGLGSTATQRTKGLQSSLPSYSSNAAAPVNIDTALQLSAVWACVKLITEAVASMPVHIYRVDRNGVKTVDEQHPLSLLFNGKVNRWQTKQEFFETIIYQKVLLGNSYSVIQRDSKGTIIGLIPLMTEQMRVDLEENGDITYRYTDGAGVKIYSQQTIWHNKIFGNGIIGLSPLGYARNNIGAGLAQEKNVSNIFKNGGKPSGILTIDKMLTKEQRERIKQNFAEMREGNEQRLFVLEADMKYAQVSLSPQDIELLSARRFTVEDIARTFGVPSVLINDTATSTALGSSIEQIMDAFYKGALRALIERLESSMEAWLLTPEDRQKYEIEFDFTSLLRPSLLQRMQSYKEAVQGGIVTPNEARAFEGWKPIGGGDTLFLQQQMTPIDDPNRGAPSQKP